MVGEDYIPMLTLMEGPAGPPGADDVRQWLTDNYPLLTDWAFEQVVMRQVKETLDATAQFGGNPALDARALTVVRNEKEATLFESMALSFEELMGEATDSGDRGAMARLALVHIATFNGDPLPLRAMNWGEHRAAEALAVISEIAGFRKEVVTGVRSGLTRVVAMKAGARFNLLLAFDALCQADDSGLAALTFEEAATILLESLVLEVERLHPDQDQEYQLALLKRMAVYRHPKLFATLEALIAVHHLEAVKQEALRLVTELRDGLRHMWEGTPVDQVSPLDSRAWRLRAALENIDYEDDTCQSVFINCKDTPCLGGDDPRLVSLNAMLIDASDKVRLAAAWALVQGPRNGLREWDLAVHVLADMAMNAPRLGYSRDALSLIEVIKERSPEGAGVLAAAQLAANTKFIERQSRFKSSTYQPRLPGGGPPLPR